MSLLLRRIPASSLKIKIRVGPRYHLMLCRPSHCGDFRTQGSKTSVPRSACFSLLSHGSLLPETNIRGFRGDIRPISSPRNWSIRSALNIHDAWRKRYRQTSRFVARKHTVTHYSVSRSATPYFIHREWEALRSRAFDNEESNELPR